MTDDRDLDRLLGLLADEGQDQPDPVEHPGDGKLSFYHAGRLPPEEAEAVREHLMRCQRCRDLLLRHAEFVGEGGEDEDGVADFGAAVEWRRVRERLGEDRRREPQPPTSWKAAPRLAPSLAAMFALALIGVSFYAGSLRRELARPITDLEPQSLRARGSQRSSGSEEQEVKLPRTVTLLVSTDVDSPRCLVELRNSNNEVVRSFGDALENGKVQFYLPERFLSPGRYRIEVLGLRGKDRQQLGTFDLRIVN